MVNNSHVRSQLTSAYKWEVLGDEVVALDAEASRVFRLTGPSAAVARFKMTGTDHGLTTEQYNETCEALVNEGLMVRTDGAVSRRKLIGVGAGVALGISVLMLPAAPAAASVIVESQLPPGTSGTTTSSSSTTSTTTTLANTLPKPNVTSVTTGSISWTQPADL